jgi:hypothetical protein
MINPVWRGRFEVGDVLIPLRRNDPVVPLLHATLASRNTLRAFARSAAHLLGRKRRA